MRLTNKKKTLGGLRKEILVIILGGLQIKTTKNFLRTVLKLRCGEDSELVAFFTFWDGSLKDYNEEV